MNPYMKKDIEKLENIQHRETRLAPNLREKSYEYSKWKKEPEKIVQGDKDGPASRNSRLGGICFRREPATIYTSRNVFFLNRVIPL